MKEKGPTSVSFTNEIGQIVPSTRQKTYVSFHPEFNKIIVVVAIIVYSHPSIKKGSFSATQSRSRAKDQL